jgi:hypothetical protein
MIARYDPHKRGASAKSIDQSVKEITLPVSEFKAKCLKLLKDVEAKGERIVITKHG